ncbi:MAG: fibrobacter succinogenes major paralogous domain-containing protein [Bacteroidia bacterium]|nr:fibrobacter succinogenes major paralogous domain-containing protein [Bacteroidia bacterium]
MRQQIRLLEDNLITAGTYKLADVEGNQYNVVKIGTQTWMKENLKTTKYNDGTAIPNVTVDATWAALTTGAYSDYNNTPANSTTYGRLYNWCAVDNNAATKVASNGGKNVCPTSWHLPTDAEWTTLTDYLTNNGYGYQGSGSDLGKSMASTSGWTASATLGTVGNDQASNNSSGFTALPGGYRYSNGTYDDVGGYGYWWSSTEDSASYAWGRHMSYSHANVYRYDGYKQSGFSVRCLRDF